MRIALVCTGTLSSSCDGRDVRLVVVAGPLGNRPRPACHVCRASADALGLPLRPWVEREPDRRRNRFVLAGEGIGRRVADAINQWRSPMT